MSQDYDTIAQTDLLVDVRQKIINRDEASRTLFLGATEPAVMAAGRPWIDTGNTLIKVRNAANTAWLSIGTFASGMGHLLLAGGTMAGDIDTDGNEVNTLDAPVSANDIARKSFIDAYKPVNKGKVWISHGDNVITFGTAHADNNYQVYATIEYAAMGGVSARANKHTKPLELFVSNESTTRGKVRINGGYGFSNCGWIAAVSDIIERFDDVANSHTGRAVAITARRRLAGYSLNGFGFTSCGYIAAPAVRGLTERFDDAINAHTARQAATARQFPSNYSLDGYGFTSCGWIAAVTGVTERFDDVANTHTGRLAATARQQPAGYGLNGYGFTSCGWDAAVTGVTERFDDVANTHTARLAATAREQLSGYGLNGFGFTSCGYIAAITGVTQRFDDVANTHTARLAATARYALAGYSLNGYGFTSCGNIAAITGTTQRFDDVANTHTARANATARHSITGYATNEYFITYFSFNN